MTARLHVTWKTRGDFSTHPKPSGRKEVAERESGHAQTARRSQREGQYCAGLQGGKLPGLTRQVPSLAAFLSLLLRLCWRGGGVGRFPFLSPACMSAVHVASPPPPPPRPPESVVAGAGTGNVFQRHAAQLSPQCLIGRCASAVATATDRLGPCSRLQIARTPPLLFSPSSSTHTHAGGLEREMRNVSC